MSVIPRAISANQALSLSDDQLRRVTPSLFAEAAHESRSDKYAYIPTVQVLSALRREGFEVMAARQTRVRDPGRRDFTRHMLRLRHADLSSPKVDDTFPEVILINSHDGTSSYRIMGGLFRLVCMNGLVVPDSLCETVRIPHKGDIRSLVIEGSRKVLENSAQALRAAEEWQKVMLSGEEQRAFATAAHYRRFADDDGTVPTSIEPDQLLTPRRANDRSPDLWRTFNRVQENAVKGGLSAVDRETGRRSTSREVRSIDGDVKLNKALFVLAEQMAAIKTASAAMAA